MSLEEETADVVVREVTLAEAAVTTKWRYSGMWSVYDGRVSDIITAANGYHAIAERATDKFLGFVCLGHEARVPGLADEADALDVGIGLDPAIIGQGKGRSIVRPVLEWAETTREASELRAVVQAWNERSLRLCYGLGFRATGHHEVRQASSVVDYVVLIRPCRPL
jgi:[ribosomal protein S18]-alanine N-acetyltransferase